MAASAMEPPITVSSPLGDDLFLLRGMTGTERLGQPFRYELDLFSKDTAIDHQDLLGQSMTVKLALKGEGTRYFNGLVSRFEQIGYGGAGYAGGYARYQAILAPAMEFLKRTADCRIFQEMTAPDVIKAIFRKHDFVKFDESLFGAYRKRIYCVQYRETDADFVHRLMEEEGIYYYFHHEEGYHTLVLADSPSSHDPIAGYEEIDYYGKTGQEESERECISEWRVAQEVQSGKYAHTDFDFEKPKKALLTDKSIPRQHMLASLEYYDYPGRYVESDHGKTYARVRIEELHSRYESIHGEGNARGLCVGGLFTLKKIPRQDQNREYLITAAQHQLHTEMPFEEALEAASTHPLYRCRLEALFSETPFRTPRITPKPLVQGPQTAMVVGKAGEEIWTDKYGRVKVQFHWDRYGKNNENSSCWVRVSHPWAGQNWGAIAIPRIGQEVIVDFLEGDPDRPIITGRVYDGDNMPPYGLPGAAVISGIKSNSTKGGGGYNEYVMDDTKGNELIREHGQYDKDSTIEHDLREHVLNDRSRDVTRDETVQIGNDRSKTVDNNETTSIGVNRTETVGSNESITIGANRTESVVANESITVGSNRTRNVGQNETVTVTLTRTHNVGVNEMVNIGAANEISVGGLQAVTVGLTRAVSVGKSQDVNIGTNLSENVGKDWSEDVGKNHSLNVGDNRTASVGKDDSLKVGKNLVIDAGDSVVIKTGKASIAMKKDGTITIKGKDITINGSGEINEKASKNIVMKGQKILQN